jgi:hypothetical protein
MIVSGVYGRAWVCLLGCALAAYATQASAQVVTNNGQNNLPFQIPGMIGQNQSLTPQQMQSIMMMRALQGRGRGQVRTGVPQGDPFAQQQPGFDPWQGAAPVDDSTDTTRKSSVSKHAEAHKAQEDQKRAARDAAKDKKAKADKKGKPDKAKAEKKPPVKKAVEKKVLEKKSKPDKSDPAEE